MRANPQHVCATFEVQRGADGKIRTGVWDRICVPTGVPDEKDGMETVFNTETLSQMVDNFVERGDQIPVDWNHQTQYASKNGMPAPALAWYGALAVVAGGALAKVGAARDISSPAPEGLDLSREGLWGYRTEVTEQGEQLLANFKYVSPTFTPDGAKRDGTPCGYCLVAVAATNTPFQEGTQITFQQPGAQSAQNKEGHMAKLAKVAKLIGMEGNAADDAAVMSALESKMEDAAMASAAPPEGFDYAAHAAQLEALAQAYEDAHMEDGEGDEPPHQTMRKMAAHARRMAKMAEPAGEPDGDEEKKAAEMARMEEEAKMAKLEAEKDKGGDAKMAAMEATLSVTREKLARLEAKEADREKAAKAEGERKFAALADSAIAGGYPKDKRDKLIAFARSDFDGAQAAVEHLLPKTSAPAQLFERLSRNGGPIGDAPTSPRAEAAAPGKPRRVQSMGRTWVEDDGDFADEVKKLANSKEPAQVAKLDALLAPEQRTVTFHRLLAAQRIVRAERPDLAAAADGE